ncbi:hypothetical protein [Methylomicrobium sp. Wu6]|uniref:hypothetical protein n=1 Tax=Methylomicrobium sp. Wu6 TaxID=3107928 RepID=UPI002DD69579|nr:hypothetical protein [Methylomicrobium sp. Wu6]
MKRIASKKNPCLACRRRHRSVDSTAALLLLDMMRVAEPIGCSHRFTLSFLKIFDLTEAEIEQALAMLIEQGRITRTEYFKSSLKPTRFSIPVDCLPTDDRKHVICEVIETKNDLFHIADYCACPPPTNRQFEALDKASKTVSRLLEPRP